MDPAQLKLALDRPKKCQMGLFSEFGLSRLIAKARSAVCGTI